MSVDERTFRPSLRTIGTASANLTTVYMPPTDDVRDGVSPDGARIAFPVGDGLVDSVMHVVGAQANRLVRVAADSQTPDAISVDGAHAVDTQWPWEDWP